MTIEGTGSELRKEKTKLWESVDQNLMFQQGLNIVFYRRFQKLRQDLISEMTKKYIPLKKKVLSDAASDLKVVKLIEQRKALKLQSQELKIEMEAEKESTELLQKKEKLDQKEQEVKRQLLKLNAQKYNLLNKANVNEQMEEKWNEISIFGAPLKVN